MFGPFRCKLKPCLDARSRETIFSSSTSRRSHGALPFKSVRRTSIIVVLTDLSSEMQLRSSQGLHVNRVKVDSRTTRSANDAVTTVAHRISHPFSFLEDLPAELLHRVFKLLDDFDVRSARATCSILSAIGNEYVLPEVSLVFHREHFERLSRMAQHPVISKHIRSIYYQVDQFSFLRDFDAWNDDRILEYPARILTRSFRASTKSTNGSFLTRKRSLSRTWT